MIVGPTTATSPISVVDELSCDAPTSVVQLGNFRAHDLLLAQPNSLIGLSQQERARLVVTAVADVDGEEYVVSRFGDAVWDLSSELPAKNLTVGARKIYWPLDVPEELLADAKAAMYCALRNGRYGRRWSGRSVLSCARAALPLLRWMKTINISQFSDLRALQLADYIADLRKSLTPGTIKQRLTIVDLIWTYADELIHPLREQPWGGSNLFSVCEEVSADEEDIRSCTTPVIPRSVQQAIFSHCETLLGKADHLFRRRDAGQITAFSYEMLPLRDAVLYLVQICSGMRNSESTGIINDAWRVEERQGTPFHWIRTREIKTRKGEVEYLVPPELLRALGILQRFAEPLQLRLRDEAVWLEEQLKIGVGEDGRLRNGMTTVEAVARLNRIREIGSHLFLCVNTTGSDHLAMGSRVDVLSVGACGRSLKFLALNAGTEWHLTNMQCRRTFAFNVANSRLGRMGLVFLKWQLKHSSMSWTQLYAANPRQSQELYRELEAELKEARVSLLEGWMSSGTPLTGGAGRKLMQLRATPVQDREQLLRLTAEGIDIRNTGHAWCISGTQGCHGQGIYDASMCAPCSQAVIDPEMSKTWQMIHLENLRLATISDCGPSVRQKAFRAIAASEGVLRDLGVALPVQQQAEEYHQEIAFDKNVKLNR